MYEFGSSESVCARVLEGYASVTHAYNIQDMYIYTFYMLHKHSYITMIIYSIVLSQDNTEFIYFSGLHSPSFSPAYCVQHHHQKYNVDLQN